MRRTRHHARTLLFQSTVVVTPCSGARVRHQCQPLSRNNYLTSRRFAPQLWSASARRRFDLRDMSRSFLSKAARLRHGRDTEVSRPGLQLGRARTRRHRADTCASVSCPASESASLTPSAVVRRARPNREANNKTWGHHLRRLGSLTCASAYFHWHHACDGL